jgi:hypothetical protein
MTTPDRLLTVALVTALAACGGGTPSKPGPIPTGGSGAEPAATGGSSGTGGVVGASSGGSGGLTGGSGGTSSSDAAEGTTAIDAAPAGASDGGPDTSSPPGPIGSVLGSFEAEASPPNVVTGSAKVSGCMTTCPSTADQKAGDMCCSGGGMVSNILGRSNSSLTFNKVSVPADGMYDVIWWYHCGKNDNFHDPNCGGEPYRTVSGCRPGQIIVNGTALPKVVQFPCFPGTWPTAHTWVTQMPLKAGGDNSIKLSSGDRTNDAVDVDRIAILPAGAGGGGAGGTATGPDAGP